MGSTRQAGAALYSFLADAQARGPVEALRALNLQALAGRPIDEIFLGVAEYVCPIGGTVDEGIARDAFVDMIADLADQGISDFDTLTPSQMQRCSPRMRSRPASATTSARTASSFHPMLPPLNAFKSSCTISWVALSVMRWLLLTPRPARSTSLRQISSA
jgi:hypothetical protein